MQTVAGTHFSKCDEADTRHLIKRLNLSSVSVWGALFGKRQVFSNMHTHEHTCTVKLTRLHSTHTEASVST